MTQFFNSLQKICKNLGEYTLVPLISSNNRSIDTSIKKNITYLSIRADGLKEVDIAVSLDTLAQAFVYTTFHVDLFEHWRRSVVPAELRFAERPPLASPLFLFYLGWLHHSVVGIQKAVKLREALHRQFVSTIVLHQRLEGTVGLPETWHLLKLLRLLSLLRLLCLFILGEVSTIRIATRVGVIHEGVQSSRPM